MTPTTAEEDLSAAKLVERPLDSEAEAALEEPALAPVEVIDHHPSVLEAAREAWQSRRLLLVLASMIITQRIRTFRLRATWLILGPFMSVLGYSLIFGGGVFDVRAPNGMPYFLFLLVGMMGWQLFMRTLMMSTRGFQMVGSTARKLMLPIVLVPIAGSAIALLQFAFLLVMYSGIIVYYWVTQGTLYAQVEPKLIFFSVAGLFLCLVLAWGIGLWTAALAVWAKDVRYVVRYMMPFWMFLTPILYPIEQLKGNVRTIAELNPLSSPIEMVKVGMLGAGSVRLYAALWSIAVITLVFVSGVWFVNRFGRSLAGLRVNKDESEDMLL